MSTFKHSALEADFPEICYAVQYAPLFFGSTAPTSVVSAGSGGTGGGAVIHYDSRGWGEMYCLDDFRLELLPGAAVLSFPSWACEVPEVCEAKGVKRCEGCEGCEGLEVKV